jgi:hypothetical protein
MSKPPKPPVSKTQSKAQAKRIEDWSEIYAQRDQLLEELKGHTRREIAVVAAAVLDSALAALLSKRFCGPKEKIEHFLGITGEETPASTFSMHTKLAQFVGLLDQPEIEALNHVREIRNRMAHRLKVEKDPEVFKHLRPLHDYVVKIFRESPHVESQELGKFNPDADDAFDALINTFAIFLVRFKAIDVNMLRLPNLYEQHQERHRSGLPNPRD